MRTLKIVADRFAHLNDIWTHYSSTSMVRHLHTNTKMYEGVFIFFIFNPVRWCHYHMLKQPFNKFSYCKQILKTIFSHNHNHHVIHNRTGQVFATPNFKKYKADTLPKLVFSLFLSSLIYPHPHPPPPLVFLLINHLKLEIVILAHICCTNGRFREVISFEKGLLQHCR